MEESDITLQIINLYLKIFSNRSVVTLQSIIKCVGSQFTLLSSSCCQGSGPTAPEGDAHLI